MSPIRISEDHWLARLSVARNLHAGLAIAQGLDCQLAANRVQICGTGSLYNAFQ